MSIPLVKITRGSQTESIHRGDIVAVSGSGEILFSYGDAYKSTFWRSSAKPFQLLQLIEIGGIERFHFTPSEIALMCASHGGEESHVNEVKALLEKLGKSVDDLDCGISRPMNEREYRRLLKGNIPFTAANNPCSGKHSGMLALGIISDIELENYINPEHPVQKIMLKTVSEMTDMEENKIDIAIDGCGVPVFGMSILNMAIAYAKLAGPYTKDIRGDALKIISHAMVTNPYFVAGTDRLDTIIMEETNGKILAKLGAESVYCMSILDKGIGIALKIEDGAYRALDALVPKLLHVHGFISDMELENINSRLPLVLYNHRKDEIGKIECIL